MNVSLPRLSHFAIQYLLLLPLGALVALVWVNMAPESYFHLTVPMTFLVNDVAMVLFFGLVTKEIVEATATGGVLHPWRRAVLPIVGAVGATVVAALIYLGVVDALDEPILGIGWPVTFTVDIAFSFLVARALYRRHPAVPFLLVVAIAANGIGFIVLALLHPMRESHLGGAALLMFGAVGLAAALRRMGVNSFWPYIFGCGLLSWVALYWGGVHPALALAPIVLFIPHAAHDRGFFADASAAAPDALSRFEIWARYPAHVALFLFGVVNCGVPFGALEQGTFGVALATLIGRPIGLVVATGLGLLVGLRLPVGVGWRDLIVIGFATAICFSLGLFFSIAMFPQGQLLSETQMGVLLSLAGAPMALLAARLLHVGRFARLESRN